MIQKNIALVLSIAILAVLPGCAKNNPQSEARKAIQSGYDLEDAAVGRKDINGAFAVHSSDCVFIGRTGKDQWVGLDVGRKDLSEALAMPNTTWKRATKIESITFEKGKYTEATVIAKQSAEATLIRTESRQIGTLYLHIVVRDYWVKGSQGWQVKREKIVSAKTKHDIKPPGSI